MQKGDIFVFLKAFFLTCVEGIFFSCLIRLLGILDDGEPLRKVDCFS